MHSFAGKPDPSWAVARIHNAGKRRAIDDFFRHHGKPSLDDRLAPGRQNFYDGYWSSPQRRRRWTRALATYLKKDPRRLDKKDFAENGLGGLLRRYRSVYSAVSDAYPELDLNEWEMARTSQKCFRRSEKRAKAVWWLAGRLKKDPRSLTASDFICNGLVGLLEHYGNSPWKAVAEACPELVKSKEDMLTGPVSIYATRESRLKLLKRALYKNPAEYTHDEQAVAEKRRSRMDEMLADDWAAWKRLSQRIIDPRDLTGRYLASKGLTGLFRHYHGSVHQLIRDLLPDENIKPWELLVTPSGVFDSEEKRQKVVRWLCEVKLKCDPRKVSNKDFANNRLWGVLRFYSNSAFIAISAAYPEMGIMPWEMENAPKGTYAKPENRADSVLALAARLGKPVEKLTRNDLMSNKLVQVLRYKVHMGAVVEEALERRRQLEGGWAAQGKPANSF